MNILSLFDGAGMAYQALKEVGINVSWYGASEIDKYSHAVARFNHPNIHSLGDVTKWYQDWDLPKIDLLIGGSPCQGFSFAGKQLNFEDERSKLFFQFVDILKSVKPKYFLLENVKMKKEYQQVITDLLGFEPIEINSALVSAQNRKRLYWTNIPGIEQPEDKGILLKDIVFSDAQLSYVRPRGKNNGGIYTLKGKSGSVTSSSWENNSFVICGRSVGRAKVNGKRIDHKQSVAGITTQEYEPRQDLKSGALSTVQKDNLLLTDKAIEYMNRKDRSGRSKWDHSHHSDIGNDKSACVVANFFKGVPYNVLKDLGCLRAFHPIEVERLQTLPDNYTKYGDFEGIVKPISNTQRYKMLGNGFTVTVIAHILRGIVKEVF